MKQNRMRLAARRTAAFVLSGTLLASSLGMPAIAYGKTDAQVKQELNAAVEQLDALQMELAQSEAVLGKTTYDLAVTKSNIADLQIRMSESRKKLVQAKQELADVIAETYKQGGDMGLLDLVLSSESFENLISRLYYANRVAIAKEDAINAVNNLQASLQSDKSVLEAKRQEQEALLAEQVAQFAAMQDAATRQATYVGSLSDEVVAALEEERVEQTIASLETAREVLSIQTADELTTTDEGATVVSTKTAKAEDEPEAKSPVSVVTEKVVEEAAANDIVLRSTTKETEATVDADDEAGELSTATSTTNVASATGTAGTSSSSGSSSGSANALAAVEAALEQVGKSYGHENDGEEWDCNGLTNYAWSQAGVEIPYASGTYAYGQFQYMKESDNWVTSEDELQAGDLVFYSQDGGDTTYHVAMYIGDGQIVHAVGYSEGVQVTDLDYVSGFVGGGTPS